MEHLSSISGTVYACSIMSPLDFFVSLSNIALTLSLPFLVLVLLVHFLVKKYRIRGWLWVLKRTLLVTLIVTAVAVAAAGIFAGFVAIGTQADQQEIEEMQGKGWYPLC